MMKVRDLQDVKVGDLVGPVRIAPMGRENRWTGVLHAVTKVSAKRFMAVDRWFDKSTGRSLGRYSSGSYYVIATAEMIAEYHAKQLSSKRREDQLKAFHARPDYKAASAIGYLLSEMHPDKHPLDRLTTAEWDELCRRLEA